LSLHIGRTAGRSLKSKEWAKDAVLDKVNQFTIGFALAGEKPAAKGSGTYMAS
jgi:hypothetical protein